jgi:hypothetical protein
LDLLLVPQCFGADGTAPGNHCQDLREMPLHLDPGEEFFFPVHLDLPPGTDMVLRLDAYQDMDLVNPHKHNYIDLHIRVATARELKGDALGTLADWAADASGGLRGKLNSAVRNLDNALADANWDEDDENVLTEAGGPSVFAAELAAANTLLGLLDSGLTADETDLINEVVLQLVDADRILADTAAAGDLAAAILIAQGDDQRLAGDYRGAMNTYKRAWQVATE